MRSSSRLPAALAYALKGVGVVLFCVILLRLDAVKAAAVFRSVPPSILLVTLGLFPPMYLLKSWRWHVLTEIAPSRGPFAESVRVYCASLFLGIVTPGKVGEAAKIPALVAKGLPARTGLLLTILDRVVDVVFMGLLGILSAAFLFPGFTAAFAAAGAVAALAACSIILRTPRIRGSAIVLHWRKRLPAIAFLTVASWILYYLQIVVLARGFALAVPLAPFLSIMTVVGILSLLPIAPAGLGTREAALLFFFALYRVPPERTIAFSFSIFLLTILGSLIGLYCWLRPPYRS